MNKKDLSYLDAITEIKEIITKIENDDIDVDNITSQVKHVSTLLKICKDKIYKAEKEVEKILEDMA